MSLNSLKNKFSSYERGECSYSNWVINPERCNAAKKYKAKLDQFVKSGITDAKKNLVKQRKLLKTRIKNNEGGNIYPIVNHDFDYKTAMKKEYNVFKRGISNKPTMSNLIDAPVKLKPYINAMLTDAYPNESTVAGRSDVIDDVAELVQIKNKYKTMNAKLPYPSFRKDYPICRYPTTGKHASSYFIKSGQCKTKIKKRQQCIKKHYNWVPNKIVIPAFARKMLKFVKKSKKNMAEKPPKGYCYKPRFSYIDNSAKGLLGKDGFAPSMFNDILNLSPDKLFNILAGYTVDGSGLLPCVEEFSNYNLQKKHLTTYNGTSFIILILLLITIIYFIKRD
jgi:hypothetical protein